MTCMNGMNLCRSPEYRRCSQFPWCAGNTPLYVYICSCIPWGCAELTPGECARFSRDDWTRIGHNVRNGHIPVDTEHAVVTQRLQNGGNLERSGDAALLQVQHQVDLQTSTALYLKRTCYTSANTPVLSANLSVWTPSRCSIVRNRFDNGRSSRVASFCHGSRPPSHAPPA